MITKEDAAYLQKLENLHELILEEVSRLGNE